MSAEAKRDVVRNWLCRQRDKKLRQAITALHLIYQPVHLDILYGMAQRSDCL